MLRSLVTSVEQLSGAFGVLHFLHGHPQTYVGRNRDIFPVCRVPLDIEFDWPLCCSGKRCAETVRFADLSLAALSFLYGEKRITAGPPNTLQLTVQRRLPTKLCVMVERLESYPGRLSNDCIFAALVGCDAMRQINI